MARQLKYESFNIITEYTLRCKYCNESFNIKKNLEKHENIYCKKSQLYNSDKSIFTNIKYIGKKLINKLN
jgi:uncharacterized C2H2 Zn-finger protein